MNRRSMLRSHALRRTRKLWSLALAGAVAGLCGCGARHNQNGTPSAADELFQAFHDNDSTENLRKSLNIADSVLSAASSDILAAGKASHSAADRALTLALHGQSFVVSLALQSVGDQMFFLIFVTDSAQRTLASDKVRRSAEYYAGLAKSETDQFNERMGGLSEPIAAGEAIRVRDAMRAAHSLLTSMAKH